MRYLRIAAILIVTCVAFGFAVSFIDVGLVWDAVRRISVQTVGLVAALLLFGALLATIRFWFMASDLGHGLSPRDAMLALSVGQIAGALTVQYFGQIAARSALLGPRGVSPPVNIVLATYERFIAAAVSATMAMAGAWYLFGKVGFNLQTGGDDFLRLLAGIAVAILAGAMFGWGAAAVRVLQQQSRIGIVVSLVRNFLLTLAIQLCTVTAYVVAAHALAPGIGMMELIAASMVVTFVASLPISFAGWGVRELSAVLALGAIGMQNEAALTVALFIGAIAMLMVIVIAIIATVMPHGRASENGGMQTRSEYLEIASAIQYVLPLTAATAVFFQVFVPVGQTLVNVNLADPVAILGGSLFVLSVFSGGLKQWRLSWFNVHVAVATAAMVLSFLHGLYWIGWSDWAFTNKLLGWLMLLGYGATAALIVRASEQGIFLLVRTFVAVAVGVVGLHIVFLFANLLGANLPGDFALLPMEGFSQNRNAFAFLLLLAICASTLVPARAHGWVLGVLFAGLWLAGSRASFGTLLAIMVFALWIGAFSTRNVLIGVAIALATLVVMPVLPHLGAMLVSSPMEPVNLMVYQMTPASSDPERFSSIVDGLKLFLSHPLIGKGLGAYASNELAHGKLVVIHSTSIWLLAEMGLIGFLAFAVPAVRIFWHEWTVGRRDPVGQMLLLVLATFGVMSLVHELLYQRAFWLLLGAGLACVVPVTGRDEPSSSARGRVA